MNNHLNILPKQVSFDLKCFKYVGGAYHAPQDPPKLATHFTSILPRSK